MPVYQNKHNGGFFVEFQYKHQRFKKRLPPTVSREQACEYEQSWRTSIIHDRIRAGKEIGFEVADIDGSTLVISGQSSKKILYIVRSGSIYKIGITDNFHQRLKSLLNNNPHGIEVILVLRVSNANIIERRLHKMFQSKRVMGEWFNLAPVDLEFITSLVTAKVVFNKRSTTA